MSTDTELQSMAADVLRQEAQDHAMRVPADGLPGPVAPFGWAICNPRYAAVFHKGSRPPHLLNATDAQAAGWIPVYEHPPALAENLAALAQRADEPVACPKCRGLGRIYQGCGEWIHCSDCNTTGKAAPAAPAPQRADEPVEPIALLAEQWLVSTARKAGPHGVTPEQENLMRVGFVAGYTAAPAAPAYVPLPGEIAYQLTRRLVIDMPTARAAVDAAIEALVVARMRGDGK